MNVERQERAGRAVPWALALLTCAMPGMYLYCNNAYELPFLDVLPVMAASVALGLIGLVLLRLLTKDPAFSALLTSAGMALFLNFNFIVGLVDRLAGDVRVRVYYFVAAGVFLLLAAAILWLRKIGGCGVACRLLLLAAGVTLIINLVTAAPGVARKLRATAYTSAGVEGAREDLPNFYYLLVDEYASFDEIEEYYDYDNSAFRDFLRERGFCVSDSSYNKFANTLRSVGDNVNLAQVSRADMEHADYQELVDNGILYGVLEGLGYELSQLGTLYPLPKLLEKQSFAIASDAATMNGESAAEILINNSMLMPLKTMRYWKLVAAEGDMALFNYLDDPANYQKKNNQAIFFYICSPHPPFYYAADGTQIEDRAQWTNWVDKSYYLGQYRYITTRLEKTISTILEQDPGAIILLQSDHGLRYHADSDLPMPFSIDEDSQRQILNALYFAGETVDITGLSGYNTLRVILTRLGLDYPVLPET